RLARKGARRELIIEHHRGVDIDEIGARQPPRGARQRHRQDEPSGQRQPRQRLAAQHEQRLEADVARMRGERRHDRPRARQHDLDLGGWIGLAQRRDAFGEAAVRAVQLVALMDAGDLHCQYGTPRRRPVSRAIHVPGLALAPRKPRKPNAVLSASDRDTGCASMKQPPKTLLILGTRGVPANHGGFETFAERYALFLAARGWRVSVYCQEDVEAISDGVRTDVWRGITRIFVQTARKGGLGALDFDWKCVRDALSRPGVCLVLGYNGAAFLPVLRLAGRKVFSNMDGIEWKRPKWPLPVRAWFYVNEWIAAWTSQRLVADHPAIAAHLASRRRRKATVVIPYGGDPVAAAPAEPLVALGLEPQGYLVSIARIEPDNNILTVVKAFSAARRGVKLVVLGKF